MSFDSEDPAPSIATHKADYCTLLHPVLTDCYVEQRCQAIDADQFCSWSGWRQLGPEFRPST